MRAPPPDIGPAIQIIVDASSDVDNGDVFLGDNEEETDFCQPMKLQTEVTIEITPHHILESQDRQCEAIRLDSISPTGGQHRPLSRDDCVLASPAVTYSTFKPHRSPSPDVVSPSPATSLNSSFSAMNSSLLAIWPTRRSFHESRASMTHPDSDSSGEEDDDSDTDVASDSLDDDAAVGNAASNEVSQSTLAASLPCSCAGNMGSAVGSLSAISDNERTPLAVPARPRVHQSKYARRNQSPTTAAAQSKPSPSLSVGEVTPRVAKSSLSTKCSKSEPSIIELHHTLDEQLSLKYAHKGNEQQRSTVMPRPIPCEFHDDYKDTFGSQRYLYAPHSNRHSFVFPPGQGVSSFQAWPAPPSSRRSNQNQRPQSAYYSRPSEPDSRSRQGSTRRSIPSLSSLFHKLFRKRSASSSAPSQPAPEMRGAVGRGTTPLHHKMAKEMKSKYSSITRHHWESDSMVVLPERRVTSLKV